jgi:hypothetical protein
MIRSKVGVVSLTMTVKLMTIIVIASLIFRQFLSTVQCLSTFLVSVEHLSIDNPAKDENIKLIHIMNAYSVQSQDIATDVTKAVSPFDQWLAIESIQRAKQHAPPLLDVEFVCAMFEEDRLALPNLPCRTVLLTRSTASQYPFLNTPNETAKVLPFIQDILDAAIPEQNGNNRDEQKNVFVMLTNSDIALTKHYYQTIWPHLMTREAFSINRLSIPTDGIDQTTRTAGDKLLSHVDTILDKGKGHPGYDCFVVHTTALQRFDLRDMFAGHPPWGTAMNAVLRIMARNYTNIHSNVNGTFHLGDDHSKWSKPKKKQKVVFADIENQINIIQECPAPTFGSHPYTLLNTINCGKSFRYDRFYNNHTIPNFVKPGYEDIYLRNYPNVLRYELPNGLGMPSLIHRAKRNKAGAQAQKGNKKKSISLSDHRRKSKRLLSKATAGRSGTTSKLSIANNE